MPEQLCRAGAPRIKGDNRRVAPCADLVRFLPRLWPSAAASLELCVTKGQRS
jgi:hypothetical protein